ncbi:MAG: cytochrome c [Usitatibacter sp.]
MSRAPVTPQEGREKSDPYELATPIPWPVLGLAAAMVLFGIFYILAASTDSSVELGDRRTLEDLMPKAAQHASATGAVDGAAVFSTRCAACHQASGAGVPGVFPPLAKSEWVQGDATRLANIVLHGVQGSLTVGGNSFSGAMPAFKDQLDDATLAAVATYIRAQWGNEAAAVDAATVAAARAATSSRATPWNGDAELAVQK